MANYGEVPYGLTDLKIYPYSGATIDTANGFRLPVGRTLEYTPKEDQTDLTGYNATAYTNVHNTKADVTLEHGGISLDVLSMISGGTIIISGVAPTETKILKVAQAGVARPYVAVAGRSLGDDGGSAMILLPKVKFAVPKGSFKEGEYLLTNTGGEAVRDNDVDGELYYVMQAQDATMTLDAMVAATIAA